MEGGSGSALLGTLGLCLVDVVDLFLKGEIIPQVGAVYPVSKIAEAHALLESGKSTGKITVVWSKD
ncbi:MAG: hypothetical protein EBU01_13800 [Crocinitomicaceae bacterium]|nr:hypothetical protein [Crocinitomicaceae bacterium]